MKLLSRLYGSPTTYQLRAVGTPPMVEMHPRELYKLLDAYYLNNGLYDYLSQALYENSIWKEALKPLRNPAYRVVEFYVAHLWPGMLPQALPIRADNAAIVEPIQRVWMWSNWSANKQVAAREMAKFGDLFMKVVQGQGQVYFQLIDPQYVTDFDVDHRGFVIYIRVDIPQQRRDGDEVEDFMHTEVWDKEDQSFKVWEHEQGVGASLNRLGDPEREAEFDEFGIDFVPFVHAKFKDIGEERGAGAFVIQLDKIDEANRKATRLAQMIFRYNKPLWALRANAMDSTGRPLPAPRISGDSGDGTSGDTIELGDDRLMRLPGNSELQGLVPPIDYDAHIQALKDDLLELEQDLPELTYYRLRDTGNLSGRALQLLLAPAIAKVIEARGNIEPALARADAMALTMAAQAGLEGFKGIGSFEAGDFEHSFEERETLPLPDFERAEQGEIEVRMGIPLRTVLRRQGWGEAELEQLDADLAEQQQAQQQTLAAAVLRAQREVDRGEQTNNLEQGE
jgi:hypothetical protein